MIALVGTGITPARAATVPNGFVDGGFGGSLSNATAMAFAPDGRLFVLQQTGEVKIIKNGTQLGTNFLSITVDPQGERGLLGIAFDPDFATNNYVYLYYTVNTSPRFNRISRFTANGDVVVSGSELVLVNLDNLTSATNHNGGAMHFRSDGKLYVAVGDNATSSNAQTLSNRHGKILRYNSDGTIPTDNPFYNTATGANRAIWALGLRNPYTFAIQRTTNRMFINDVGQSTNEEVNDGIAGSNYGWPNSEGPTTNTNHRTAYYYYGHNSGTPTGCAITGGAFYNPVTNQFPASYTGKYFFADYCSGWIYYLDPTLAAPTNANPTAIQTPTSFATGASSPVDLKVGPDGALYYLQRSGVRRITYPAGQVAPTITQHPENRTVAVGQTATFTVSANGTTPLSYQWQKNGTNITGATNASYTTPATVIGDNGATFRCVVTNSVGSATSNAATLTVTQRQPPTVQITSPTDGTLFSGNQQFNYSGTASDAVDGTLPASAYSWSIVLHHDTHTHPFLGPITGVTNGNFTIPNTGHTETNIYYRISLTVTNSASLSSTVSVDLDPRLVNLTLETNPPGLNITVDGQPFAAPYTTQSVVGVIRSIGADTQTRNGRTFTFSSWSDSGAATHDVTTPATNTTYTAVFGTPADRVGIYRGGAFYLRNSLTTGAADNVIFFGQSGWLPVAGDWNNDGVDTIGVFDPNNGVFHLRNSNTPGAASVVFAFGGAGDTPLAGRWDNTMTADGIGVFRSSNGTIHMRRALSGGAADIVAVIGIPGDVGIAGDWNGNGFDSVGVYRPSTGNFYLSNSTSGVVAINHGPTINGVGSGATPIIGDWTGAGASRIGGFTSGELRLATTLNGGNPDINFYFGAAGDRPVAGRWTSGAQPPLILVPPGSSGDPSFSNPDSGDAD
jgi:glucose/arabinose dehydrogenase